MALQLCITKSTGLAVGLLLVIFQRRNMTCAPRPQPEGEKESFKGKAQCDHSFLTYNLVTVKLTLPASMTLITFTTGRGNVPSE